MKQNESPKIEFAILDYLPVGMCIIDKNFIVQFWNKTLANTWYEFIKSLPAS